MADSKFCAGCLRDNEAIEAISWCSDCGELVCKHCGRVHARFASPHKVVPLEQANKLSSSVLNLSKNCEKHTNQKLILFCCQHDQIICASCVPKNHQNCKSVISIEDAAKGVRNGVAVDDLERRLTNLCGVLDKLINESYDSDVDLQSKDIQKQISEIRKKINSHFDQIEDDLKRETESKRTECKQKVSRIKNELKIKVDNMRQWQKDIVSLKVSGSEMHLFQAVKFLDIQTHKNEAEVRNIQQEGTTQSLIFFPSENASKIETLLLAFGTGRIVKNRGQTDQLELLKQGQQYFGIDKSKVITKSSSFISSALEENAQIRSGCFAPGNKLFLCDFTGKCLYICNHDGSDSIKKTFEYELTQVTMYDANKALISMFCKGILLFDVSSLTCGKQISTTIWSGVASASGIIWLRDCENTLLLIDINGKVVNKITTDFFIENICVSPAGGNVYCSDGSNAVHMVTPTGRQTKFYERINLKQAGGLAADEKGNVFVAGMNSNNIHKISSDGKTAEVVLSDRDGLYSPRELAYNISSNELLVVNNRRSVVIYKIQ